VNEHAERPASEQPHPQAGAALGRNDQVDGTLAGTVLTALVSVLLACPPTTTAAKSDPPGFFAAPHGWPIAGDIAQPSASAPDPAELPLWDLEAAQRQLGDTDDAPWLAWALAEARGQRETAHAQLVASLSAPTLTPARLLWWLPLVTNGDARDALLDAHARAVEPRTAMLLALGLAITHAQHSCPVALGPDGACWLANGEHLLRRDGVALELAQMWQREALRHAKRLRLADDLALAHLLGLASLLVTADTYEATLAARLPEGLRWTAADSADRSAETRRLASFLNTQLACVSALSDELDALAPRSPQLAAQVLLRRARLLLSVAASFDLGARTRRDDARSLAETGERTWICALLDTKLELESQALDLARQCVEITTTLGGPAQIGEACRALLESHRWQDDVLAELVPEPMASTVVHTYGVVDLDQ
jgi:hypothetical protein